MAVTQNTYTGDGSTTQFAFTFPYLDKTDVQVKLNSVTQAITAYSFANATTIQMTVAPAVNDKIIIYRNTRNDNKQSTFYAGSAIKAEDLNNNFDQILYVAQEVDNNAMSTLGDTAMQGDMLCGGGFGVSFEGTTDDSYETRLEAADPTADRTITLPNHTGNVVVTGLADQITATELSENCVDSSELADGSIDTSHIADSQVTTAKLATSAVTTAKIADDAVTNAKIGADAVTGAEIADNTINSEHYADGSIDRVHLAADIIDSTKLNDTCINSEHFTAGCIDTAHIADDQVTAAKLANTSVTAGSYTATDLTVDAQGRITAASNGTIAKAEIANDAIDGTKIEDNAINSEHYVDGSIDTDHIGDLQVTRGKIANDAIDSTKLNDTCINSEHFTAGCIDTAHIADLQVTTAKIAADAVTTAKIADAELKVLAGMQGATASILADSTALAATNTEINGICDGMTKQATITDSDVHYPTSGAVVDYVEAQLLPFGGFEVIATEVLFPNTQPVAGVVISISDAGGVVFNGSGVSTTGRTVGGSTVTINGAPSSLYSETLVAGVGMMVSSTGSSQTYNYHKILGKEDDIKKLSDDINDFNARYRVASSAPGSSNDAGDLYYDTTANKMKVYNATTSEWDDVASSSSSYIVTLTEAFDGSRTDFTMSTSATDAQSTIVSINGVIQKPNAGESTPSEGFAISNNTLKLSNAPATGSDYFVVVLGDTVSIGTPSDNTVSAAKIQSGAVETAKLATDAVDGTKIADNAIDSEHYTDGSIDTVHIANDAVDGTKLANNIDIAGSLDVTNGITSDATVSIINTSANPTLALQSANNGTCEIKFGDGADAVRGNIIYHNGTAGEKLQFNGYNNTERLNIDSSGNVNIPNDTGKLRLGTGNDLEIYHNGSNNYIVGATTGHNTYIGATNGQIQLQPVFGTDHGIIIKPDDAVELYYDGDKTLETTDDGIEITGKIATQKFTATNTYSATDTTQCGYQVQNLSDTTDTYAALRLTAGDTSAATAQIASVRKGAGSNDITFQLESSNTAKEVMRMASDGVISCQANTRLDILGNAKLVDDAILYVGTGNDLQIYHDGDHSYIEDSGTGELRLRSNQFTVQNAAGTDTLMYAIEGGAVGLKYNDGLKFETDDDGAKVTGFLHAHGLRTDSDFTTLDRHVLQSNNGNVSALTVEHSNNSDPNGILIFFSDDAPDNGSDYFLYGQDNVGSKFAVYSSGDVWTADDGTLSSDETLKENIVDATSKLEDIKKLKVRNFNWKSSYHPEQYKYKKLGFIAQEVEEVFPSLITEHNIAKEGDTPVMKKGIKQAWDPIIIKALQEAIAKIETLETKVAALEAA